LVIETRNLIKRYKMGKVEVRALRGVDMTLKEGEYAAIMGPSGSGKSTLMHILGCLDTPTSGEYRLMGREVQSMSEPELAEIRRTETGFVFQSYNLLPRLTAMDNVELPMTYAGMSARARRERAAELLERVGLTERRFHRPSELSGGEAQRVALARALANDPKIVLADEPTGNLDSKTGEGILTLLDEIHRAGKTLILVTHDESVADRAERVIRLLDGRVEDRGT
jgi:putative ABC transport system ATP-binding protein